jgi:hypothetical protein
MVQSTFSLSPEMRKRVKRAAGLRQITTSELVRDAIEMYLAILEHGPSHSALAKSDPASGAVSLSPPGSDPARAA